MPYRPRRSIIVGAVLLGLAALSGAFQVSLTSSRSHDAATAATGGGITAGLSASTTLERIAFGSCLHQSRPQPIWTDVLAVRPQLMLMMGDNVYGDFNDAAGSLLKSAYEAQGANADFARARTAVPMLPIWDDHDYGLNDGGAEFAYRSLAAKMFHEFWGLSPQRPLQEGIYYSRIYGPPGRRVQIIMLDTRSARSGLRRKTGSFPHWGAFEPKLDGQGTILGERQWAWLEAELRRPAELRLVVSSIQVLAEGHGWERWGNLPHERERLLDLIAANAAPTLILSGDRHAGAIYAEQRNGRRIVEATSSSLNLPPRGPNRDARIPPLVSDVFATENFGLLAVHWEKRSAEISIAGLGGKHYAAYSFPLGH